MLDEVGKWVELSLVESERQGSIASVQGYESSDVVAKGDNYTSDLSRLTLRVTLNSGATEQRTVIYKCLPSTAMRQKHIQECGIFVVEKRMYTEVLPLMEKIRREKETGEPLFGRCYAATYQRLLLEDLAVLGYKMGNRLDGLDYDHCKLLMKALGKYHALGAVLKERGELFVFDFENHFIQRNLELMGDYYKACFESLSDVMKNNWKGDWTDPAERVGKKAATLMDDLIASFAIDKKRFNTLNHGDCWVNNMLFKYGEDGQPSSVRFIDFQMAFYNTPGLDLQYFLSTSPRIELMPRKKEFIGIYHEALVAGLERFGYSGQAPSLEDILHDFHRSGVFGLAMAVMILPFLKMPSKEVPDIEELLQNYEETKNISQSAVRNTSEDYERAIQFVINEALANGVI